MLWPDVHQALAGHVRGLLAPLVRPRYVARLAIRYETDHPDPGEIQVMYPDVDVSHAPQRAGAPSTTVFHPSGHSPGFAAPAPAPLVLQSTALVEVKLVTIELHDRTSNRLVTAIEVLSPVNKRPGSPSLQAYRRRRETILDARASLVELDLLRQGERPPQLIGLPPADYFVFVTRAEQPSQTEVWPLSVRDPLPVIPVPLMGDDPDVPLRLANALSDAYDEAGYDLSVDYGQPPVPPLSEADWVWARGQLERTRPE